MMDMKERRKTHSSLKVRLDLCQFKSRLWIFATCKKKKSKIVRKWKLCSINQFHAPDLYEDIYMHLPSAPPALEKEHE